MTTMTQPQQHQQQQHYYQKQKVEIFCRGCNAEIRFDKNHRTATSKCIPLNMDLSHHDCPSKKQKE
jgi:hypothetical protein